MWNEPPIHGIDSALRLAEPGVPPRVNFREGQVLRAADLTEEQAYLIEQQRRHIREAHGFASTEDTPISGILRGLRLEMVNASGDVELSPGIAVDALGRLLIVERPILITRDVLDQVNVNVEDTIFVWLVARETTVDGRPAIQELAVVRLEPAPDPEASTTTHDPRVLLGKIMKIRLPVIGAGVALSSASIPTPVVNSTISNIALKGERVVSATNTGELRIGLEPGQIEPAFALRLGKLADSPPPSDGTENAKANADAPVDVILHQRGITTFRGDLNVRASLIADEPDAKATEDIPTAIQVGSSKDSLHALTLQAAPAPPKVARPWTMQLVDIPGETPDSPTQRCLRILIADPGEKGDRYKSQWVVAARENPLIPTLAVTAERMAVIGSARDYFAAQSDQNEPLLYVTGQLIQGPVRPDPTDPRFKQIIDELLRPEGRVKAMNLESPSFDVATKKLTLLVTSKHSKVITLEGLLGFATIAGQPPVAINAVPDATPPAENVVLPPGVEKQVVKASIPSVSIDPTTSGWRLDLRGVDSDGVEVFGDYPSSA